ncbi:choice-of-anchor L domain-containing protein, partial [Flavobacterium rhizosphaerae]
MKKILLLIFLFFGLLGLKAQSGIVVVSTNPDNTYQEGETLTWSIMVTNTGTTPVTNVNVFYALPADIYIPPNPTPTGVIKFWWENTLDVSGVNTNLNDTLPTLNPGQTVVYTLHLKIPDDYTTPIQDVAVTWDDMADIVIVNTDNHNFYLPGTTSQYTVTVTNNGPDTATNINISEPVPAGITNFSWSGNGASGSGALSNVIASLPAGESVTYTVTLDVPATYTGNLTTTVSYSSTAFTDYNPGCTACTDTNTAAPTADIVLVNTNNQTSYVPGQQAVYTVTVTNNGPATVYDIDVFNAIPAGVTQFSWTGNGGSGTNVPLEDTIVTLANGQSVTYTITLTVPEDATGDFISTASFSAAFLNDTDPSCAGCTDTDTPPNEADIVVVNTNNQYNYIVGQPSVYTVTVTNNGPADATNVVVSNPIPAGITGFSWVGDNGSSGTNTAINDAVGTLAAGQTITYTVTLNVPAAYNNPTLESTVTVTSDTPDPNPACDACTDIDVDTPLADIVVVNTDDTLIFTPGTTAVYTVTVTNNGPSVAQNVNVSNAIPAGITQFSWTGDNGSSGTNMALNDAIPVLGIDETVTYTITIDIPAGYAGQYLTSETVVTSDTSDPEVDCEFCTDTDILSTIVSDIVVVNTDNTNYYTPGSTLVYTVTVTNNGPAAATAVEVSGVIPAGITSYSWSGDNGSSGTDTDLADTIATLANGQTVTYTITLDVPAGYTGSLTNTVTATTSTDPYTDCGQCTDVDYDNANEADIVVVNTNNQDIYNPDTTTTYTITVTNNGPDDAIDVTVTNTVPAGLTNVTWQGNGTSGTGDLNDNIPVLAVGQTVTYTLTGDIPAGSTADIVSETVVASVTTDPDTTCPDCIDTDTAYVPYADIVTTKTLASGTTYTAGLNAVYTITVTNQGPEEAQNVVVNDNVPAGLTPATASWSGNGTSGTGNLTNTIGSMAVGQTVTYQVTIPIPSDFDQDTNIVNQVVVTSSTADPNPDCPGCTHTATPNPQADLLVLKTNGQTTYNGNESVTYTILVTNPGPSDAYNVVVHDNKPYNIQVMTWERFENTDIGLVGDGSSGTMNDIIPVIPVGATIEYSVTLFVPENHPSFVGNLKNVVTVTSDTPDPVPACPTCTDIDNPRGIGVTVSKNQYTVEELVYDVLIDTDCADISNVTWSAGNINIDNETQGFGIGYFEKNNSNFPIKDGIIIRGGNVMGSAGQYDGSHISTESTGWNGIDADLQGVSDSNPNSNGGTIRDVSYLQFNFVPLSDHMSFEFLFAANEYGQFQCGWADVFAFLLSDITDPTAMTNQNIAVLPVSGTPVSVTNIRNNLYNPGCGSANAEYFGQYNVDDPSISAINHRGQTVVLTAESDVIAGHTYKIKLAVGDYGDTQYDSAVFLEAGSFDIGQPQLPDDLTIAVGTALCPDEVYYLTPEIAPGTSFVFNWEKDGELILDNNGDPVETEGITVTEPGVYTLLAYFPLNPGCALSTDIRIEYRPEIPLADPEDLIACGVVGGTGTFDLTSNTPIMTAPLDSPGSYDVFYYTSLQDLQDDEPSIFPSIAYVGNDGQTIYARIQGVDNDCYTVRSFNLIVQPCGVPAPVDPMYACDPVPYDGSEIFDLTAQYDDMMDPILTPENYTVTYHTNEDDALNTGNNPIVSPETFNGTTQTIYIRVVNNFDPDDVNVVELDLIVTSQPEVGEFEDVIACDAYSLPPLTEGNYYTQSNGGGTMLNTDDLVLTTQTIYVFAQQGTAPNACTDETSFEVTILETPDLGEPTDVNACGSYTLPILAAGNYYTATGGTGSMIPAETEITTTQDIYIYAEVSESDVTCSDEIMFHVEILEAPVLVPSTALEVCDDDTDGLAEFDLT